MTQEEAIALLNEQYETCKRIYDCSADQRKSYPNVPQFMEAEKGATYLDKLCHKFYDHPKGHGEKTDYVCRICGGPLEICYCEERLYLVQCADCGTFSLVKTANPEDAARVTLARPTLNPPNELMEALEAINNAAVAYIEGGPYENDLPGLELALEIDRLSRDFVRPPEESDILKGDK